MIFFSVPPVSGRNDERNRRTYLIGKWLKGWCHLKTKEGLSKDGHTSRKKILKVQEQRVSVCQKMSKWERWPDWMDKEVLKELRETKRVYHLWKEEQISQEMFKDVTRPCRKKIRETKTQLELNLATAVKDNKKCFY